MGQTDRHYTEWGKNESISFKIRNKTRVPFLSLLFNIIFEILARARRQEKEIIGI
jgi:hypothetical protein